MADFFSSPRREKEGASAPRVGSKVSIRPKDLRHQYTECPSCNKEYDDLVHSPRVLPCLHATCISCLESSVTRGSVKCPSCDMRHSVPNGDLELFRTDETRLFLVNHLKVQGRNPDIRCQECESSARFAKYRCKECAQFLCNDCFDAHSRTKVTKRHHVSGIEDLREAPLEDFQQTHYCPVSDHGGQSYAFYCMSCDCPVCALCAVSEHQESKGHDIRELQEVYGDVRRSIENLMSDVKHRTLSAQDTASSVATTLDNLDTNLKQTTNQIDSMFDGALKSLERRRTELKDKAYARMKDKKKKLENQMESITYHINSMEDATEFASNLSTYGSLSEYLFFKDTIIDRLNNLRDEEFDTLPHDNDDIKFKAAGLGDDFGKHVRTMGEIWTTSAYAPNTQVEVKHASMDKEKTILKITLFDSEGIQQTDDGVDIRVEVMEPSGRRRWATVVENKTMDGGYKALYMPAMKGKHKAVVYLHGTPVQNEYLFHVDSSPDRRSLRSKEDFNTSQPIRTATPSDVSDNSSPLAYHVLGDIICPGFVLDSSTSSPCVEVIEDGKTMKTKPHRSGVSRRPGRQQGRFAIFRGAMANRPFQKPGLYYFEVGVVYRINKLIRQEHVFEIGLSKLDCIDRHPSVDCHPYAWCVSARGCHVCGKVCLQTWHNGQLLSHSAISARTRTPPGTFIRLYYGFLLDAEKRHWIVTDVKNRKLIFRFKNLVVSELSEPLWPVFAVATHDSVQAMLTIKTGRIIDTIPEEALRALSV